MNELLGYYSNFKQFFDTRQSAFEQGIMLVAIGLVISWLILSAAAIYRMMRDSDQLKNGNCSSPV